MFNFLKGNSSKQDVAECLTFIAEGKAHAWSDFTDIIQRNSEIEDIRLYVLSLEGKYPPRNKSEYLSPEGIEIVAHIARCLRDGKQFEKA